MTPPPDRPTSGDLPRLYWPAEVAAALGVSEWWVKSEARNQRIPAVKVAGAWRFTAEHFAQIVSQCEQQAEPARTETTTTRRRQQPTNPGVVQLQARTPRRQRHTA